MKIDPSFNATEPWEVWNLGQPDISIITREEWSFWEVLVFITDTDKLELLS